MSGNLCPVSGVPGAGAKSVAAVEAGAEAPPVPLAGSTVGGAAVADGGGGDCCKAEGACCGVAERGTSAVAVRVGAGAGSDVVSAACAGALPVSEALGSTAGEATCAAAFGCRLEAAGGMAAG